MNHAVRTDRWRYIRYADGSEELYDHANDPYEHKNLAADPGLAQTKAMLAERLPSKNVPFDRKSVTRRKKKRTRPSKRRE